MAPELQRHSVPYDSHIRLEAIVTCSGESELDWSYVLDGTSVARGSLTWDACGERALNEYAVQLVRFAEELMEDGCPPERPPAYLPGAMVLSSNSIDADEQSLDVAGAELTRAWRALAAGAACQPAR